MVSGSPSKLAGSDSAASASSRPPASSTSPSAEKDRRTGEVRLATRDTRRTASVSASVSTDAVAAAVSGNSERYFGNSPSSSRVVVRRVVPARPNMPSPLVPAASASVTSAPAVSDFAASARVRAGTSAVACSDGSAGCQRRVRTASR